MKCYSRVSDFERIDSVVWRNKPNPDSYRAVGVLIPLGRRALMLGYTSWSCRVLCSLVYMHREDAITAPALKRWDKRMERAHG